MRKTEKIRVVEYVHVGEEIVEISQLTQQQRKRVDQWIVTEWLNGLFLGQAEFSAPETASGFCAE